MEEYIKLKLKAMDKPIVNSGFPYIMTTCLNPAHNDSHPSFSINLETGGGKCFGCGFYVGEKYWLDGELSDEELEEMLRTNKYNALRDKLQHEEEVSPMLYMPPKDEDVPDGWRGLTKETIDALGLYICQTGHFTNRVIFPMLNEYGNICAFNTRALGDEQPKYKYSKGIKVDELVYPRLTTDFIGDKNYIVVVEGIMDAISMWQDGIPAILNFGVNNTIGSKKIGQLLKLGVETIYLGLDNDEAGLKGIQRYMESDLDRYFQIKMAVTLPELKDFYASGAKDYNEYLESKVG